MREAKLSPEKLAKRLGISNMTIRRWMKDPNHKALPSIYEKAVQEAIYQMVMDGELPPESQSFQTVLKRSQNLSFQAALKGLGFTANLKGAPGFAPDHLMMGLSQIGAKESQKLEVDKNHKKIWSFGRLGKDWKERISTLMKVLTSTNLTMVDKLVAYGALFYLLSPFDLIPDSIPVFGLMDDYVVMGLAAAHYLRKFGKIT